LVDRGTANWVRFVLGVLLAVGTGVAAHLADGGQLMTLLLPLSVLLLVVADLVGYLGSHANPRAERAPETESDTAPQSGPHPDS